MSSASARSLPYFIFSVRLVSLLSPPSLRSSSLYFFLASVISSSPSSKSSFSISSSLAESIDLSLGSKASSRATFALAIAVSLSAFASAIASLSRSLFAIITSKFSLWSTPIRRRNKNYLNSEYYIEHSILLTLQLYIYKKT